MNEMKLSHYSTRPFRLDRTRNYKFLSPDYAYFKPHGLWVSVDGEYDWPWFCTRENFQLTALNIQYRICLKKKHNILIIKTDKQFRSFIKRFQLSPQDYSAKRGKEMELVCEAFGKCIDWPKVTQKYQGIIISPYRWEHRLEQMWYYSWDCASGCIWDLSAIHAMRLVKDSREVNKCLITSSSDSAVSILLES